MKGEIVYGKVEEDNSIGNEFVRISARDKRTGELSKVDTEALSMMLLDHLIFILKSVGAEDRIHEIMADYGSYYEQYEKFKQFNETREKLRAELEKVVKSDITDLDSAMDHFDELLNILEKII